jgi:excinuclease ABC subunit C
MQLEDFERAIVYRDKLAMLDNLARKNIADLRQPIHIDCIALATDGAYSVVSVLIVRHGKMMGVSNYNIIDATLSQSEALTTFAGQFYNGNLDAPDQIVTRQAIDGIVAQYVYGYTKKTPDLIVPKRGVKYDLLATAQKNADDYLNKSRSKEQVKHSMTIGAVQQLQNILKIPSARRIECYDISNISGTDKVASQSVFIDGEAAKKQYRKYRIKTVHGADDFASMHEVLKRRLTRAKGGDAKFIELPDLIVIDGGKGQLSSAHDAMLELGYANIAVIALAKRDEEIYLPGTVVPIVLPKEHNALKLLQRVRDEAHRFAVNYHRVLRHKTMLGE